MNVASIAIVNIVVWAQQFVLMRMCRQNETTISGTLCHRYLYRHCKDNIIFITLEDETGIANIILWASRFERFRSEVMGARLLLVEGRVQKSVEGVIHLMAERVMNRTKELRRLSADHDMTITLSRADEFLHPQVPRGGHPRDVRILPKSRDFH